MPEAQNMPRSVDSNVVGYDLKEYQGRDYTFAFHKKPATNRRANGYFKEIDTAATVGFGPTDQVFPVTVRPDQTIISRPQ